MDRSALRVLGNRLLEEARTIRTAYPDADAMREVNISEVQKGSLSDDRRATTFWEALGYLHAEMVLVREGKAGILTVLIDEIAHVESLLPYL